MTALLQLDTQWTVWLHQTFSNGLLHDILPFWRSKFFWAPLYLGVFVQLLFTLGHRRTWIWVLGLICCIVVADTVSSKIIKKAVGRVRPCNEVSLDKQIRELVPCGVGYSFPSSHAANHMAMAMFWSLTIGANRPKHWRWVAYFWAVSIAFAQVIVGVHYVIDIVFGLFLGLMVGYIVSYGYDMLQRRFLFTN